MIDDEKLLPLCDAIEEAYGYRPHLSTAIRWATRGIGDGHQKVRLESKKIGGRRLTSAPAVRRFGDATTAASVGGVVEPHVSPRQQAAAAERAAKQLAARLD